jgi:CBS domain-containing protein
MIGQGMALLFGFVGLFSNPFLLFIALFVWIGAGQEAGLVQMKTALGGIPVSHTMLTDFRTLSPSDTLARAIELVLAGSQHDFPVVDDDTIVGVLTRGDLLKALPEHGEDWLVGHAMQRDFQTADVTEMLESAMQRLQLCACHTLPVVRGRQLVGLLTMENVGEFLMIRAALGGPQVGGPFKPTES